MSMTYSLQSDNDRRSDSATEKIKHLYHSPKRERWKAEKRTQSPMSVLNKLLIYCYPKMCYYPKLYIQMRNSSYNLS